MIYTAEQRHCAIAWKKHTSSLPDEARAPAHYIGKGGRPRGGPYPFCLPKDFAPLNLLPEVRAGALAIFDELAIPWHAGVAGGPSNHLLSSQVQCVNALGQMVRDPDRIAVAFAGVVGVGRV